MHGRLIQIHLVVSAFTLQMDPTDHEVHLFVVVRCMHSVLHAQLLALDRCTCVHLCPGYCCTG